MRAIEGIEGRLRDCGMRVFAFLRTADGRGNRTGTTEQLTGPHSLASIARTVTSDLRCQRAEVPEAGQSA